MAGLPVYDYVVVGAGAAGCVVAARLTEDPSVRVLLLESGQPDTDPNISVPLGTLRTARSELDWCDVSVPQPQLGGRQIAISAGRVVGGSGSINFTAWCRGHRADYDGWAEAGMKGWAWDDVLPYFRRSEDNALGSSALHGTGGPIAVTTPHYVNPLSLAFVTAGVEYGLPLNRDFNGTDLDGVGLLSNNVRDGVRSNGAREYLRPALTRPNLTLRTGVHVERVLLEEGTARGVIARWPSGQSTTYHAETVVLSAGAIRSPQLLMLSGIGPAEHLRAMGLDVVVDLPGVGQNFQDHPVGMAAWPIIRGKSHLDAAATPQAQQLYQQHRRGPLSAIVQVAAFLRCGERAQAPDVVLSPMLFDMTGSRGPALTCLVTLLTPQSRGSVRLASADPNAAPLLDPRYLDTPTDRHIITEGLRRAIEIGESPTLRSALAPLSIPTATDNHTLLETTRNLLISMNHPVGTCRAGTDSHSVVDPTLAVHAINGLHVIDASVMPNLPRSYTHAPTIMIAERATDLLIQRR